MGETEVPEKAAGDEELERALARRGAVPPLVWVALGLLVAGLVVGSVFRATRGRNELSTEEIHRLPVQVIPLFQWDPWSAVNDRRSETVSTPVDTALAPPTVVNPLGRQPGPAYFAPYSCPKWFGQSPVAGVVGELRSATLKLDARRNATEVPHPAWNPDVDVPLPTTFENYRLRDGYEYWRETGHNGIYTCNVATPGPVYQVRVTGLYTYNEEAWSAENNKLRPSPPPLPFHPPEGLNFEGTDLVLADAECSTTADDATWVRRRDVLGTNPERDWRDLWINEWANKASGGEGVDWTPVTDANGDGCADDPEHTYVANVRFKDKGPIRFRIADRPYWERDNRGFLSIDVTRLS